MIRIMSAWYIWSVIINVTLLVFWTYYFEKQILIMLTLMLTSKGIAGVPRVSLVVLTGTLSGFNLPVVGVAILLGIDQILDMGRTTVNLIGNCVATTVVARWEGIFDYEKMAKYTNSKKIIKNNLPNIISGEVSKDTKPPLVLK